MDRQASAWEKEYLRKGTERIESSYTDRPERCVRWFQSGLLRSGKRDGRLLDVGCGRGRNSLPFIQNGWSVTGLDIALPALREFRRRAQGLPGRLRILPGDMRRPLPFADAVFDVVLEMTAADNLTGARARKRFWKETARVLKPGGWMLSYYFNPRDGYYGPLLRRSARRTEGVLFDRRAHMRFRFYRAGDIVAASRGRLRMIRSKRYRYPGPMFGRTYMRDLTAAVFRRMPARGKGAAHAS